jgi:uncharacterized protein YlaI
MGNCICTEEVKDEVKDRVQHEVKDRVQDTEEKVSVEIIPNITKKMSNHYTIHYPVHEKRRDSALYRRTRRQLIVSRGLKCFICDRSDTLETHHFYCEKYAQNAIDWKKFGEFAKGCYNIQTGENIGVNFDWTEVEKNPDIFVDSPYNMVVLCKQHHTSGNKGLHHVPFPDWILQKYPKNNFQFLT